MYSDDEVPLIKISNIKLRLSSSAIPQSSQRVSYRNRIPNSSARRSNYNEIEIFALPFKLLLGSSIHDTLKVILRYSCSCLRRWIGNDSMRLRDTQMIYTVQRKRRRPAKIEISQVVVASVDEKSSQPVSLYFLEYIISAFHESSHL